MRGASLLTQLPAGMSRKAVQGGPHRPLPPADLAGLPDLWPRGGSPGCCSLLASEAVDEDFPSHPPLYSDQ